MKFSLTLLLFFVIFSGHASAQTTSLHGQVTDQNGAVVAGARVNVHGPAGITKTATTDGAGSYSFSNLPPGDYTVEASGPIIGNITSPLFGLANQSSDAGGFGFSESANNRRFELQTRFTF